MIFPKETAHFGFFEDGSFDRILPTNQVPLSFTNQVILNSQNKHYGFPDSVVC